MNLNRFFAKRKNKNNIVQYAPHVPTSPTYDYALLREFYGDNTYWMNELSTFVG